MTFKDASVIANEIAREYLGEENLVEENLSNITSFGGKLVDVLGVERAAYAISDKVGKTYVIAREYKGAIPSVLRDSTEYGSIVEMLQLGEFGHTVSETWMLQDGVSYDTNVYRKPKAKTHYWNQKEGFRIDASFAERQFKSAFRNGNTFVGFISGIRVKIQNQIESDKEAFVLRTINGMTAETLVDAFPGGVYTGAGNTRAINILKRYNDTHGTNLQFPQDAFNPDLLRFMSFEMKRMKKRLQQRRVLYNVEGNVEHTPADLITTVMLDDFKSAAEVYLYDANGQFRTDYIQFPADAETVVCWQGPETDDDVESCSSIDVTTPLTGEHVKTSGIVGVMFDKYAVMVMDEDHRVTSHYVESAEFLNEFHFYDLNCYGNLGMNYVVFYMA